MLHSFSRIHSAELLVFLATEGIQCLPSPDDTGLNGGAHEYVEYAASFNPKPPTYHMSVHSHESLS